MLSYAAIIISVSKTLWQVYLFIFAGSTKQQLWNNSFCIKKITLQVSLQTSLIFVESITGHTLLWILTCILFSSISPANTVTTPITQVVQQARAIVNLNFAISSKVRISFLIFFEILFYKVLCRHCRLIFIIERLVWWYHQLGRTLSTVEFGTLLQRFQWEFRSCYQRSTVRNISYEILAINKKEILHGRLLHVLLL